VLCVCILLAHVRACVRICINHQQMRTATMGQHLCAAERGKGGNLRAPNDIPKLLFGA
jgi:hypothetical protein